MLKNHIHTPARPARALLRVASALALVLGFAAITPALAQQRATHLQVSRAETGATQHLEVGQNKSLIVDLPTDVREVIVSQPNVATAIMRSKQRAIVQGVSVGETNIFFLDAKGARISVLEISVNSDASSLEGTIARIVPGSRIRAEAFGERVVLSGSAQSADDVEKAIAIAGQFAQSPENVASIVSVEGSQQVMLKVTVAEVSREVVKQLGINLSASFSAGNLTTSLLSQPSLGGASNVVGTNAVGVGLNAGNLAIDATLRALERRGAARTLAEPTLTALSGQEASFLAGGQFPVPSGYDNGVVTFEFRQFGVDLTFTPTVKSRGLIGLTVQTKVSEPTTEGSFTIGDITVPATKDREASTSVELQSGTTLAIAGLMEDKVRQQFNELPGISKLPILGALFRSRDFVHSQTELLILVTPVLAHAGGPVELPTDRITFAGDAEAVFLGHMEKLYGVGGSSGAGQYQGSVGFVLD
ncbi:type II and III secretion system protein family protein [Mariluticola halotolerans]|uniref:type II and III secretion system protein family protein n=1 Tax=Mariluticola halotolerans TaxID=2909283 RepID=UPI0026E3D888|nr:type II and III secretion system protein family protein [Mariluticola halotolerans]UJQ93163.1 type II and III secretion system protein family protein [Mariluticola halotolerans]